MSFIKSIEKDTFYSRPSSPGGGAWTPNEAIYVKVTHLHTQYAIEKPIEEAT